MRKLSEIKGDEAVDVLAALMSPVTAIFSDKEVSNKWKKKGSKMVEVASFVFKQHKDAVIDMLVILDGRTRKEYLAESSVASIIHDVMVLFDDPDMQQLFTGAGQEKRPSGSATENTKGSEK